ncbi:efflux RND transporter periplasmic adaptor subunit [Paraburkholderia sp. 5N]|uniref:Efflux RND transporter periplasmic adaptor subunit n=2 Tax=Paraburkholderia elongata TaxID=2675747 RepID=A0A972NPI0_9BURK|nr:efflux RND transporter periplasmic adaptor subunit [Paraburkholderia elongata]
MSLLLSSRLSIVSIGLLSLFGCGKNDPPPAPPAPQVGVMEAEPSNVPLNHSFVGRLSPYYSANVTARVSGVLTKRLYTEGSEVKAGQTLFQIDPTYYQTVLDNDLATLAQDQATFVNDRTTAERYHKLLPIGSVSQQTVDDADAAERSAAAKVKADEAAVEGARVNLGYTKVTSPITGIAGQQQVTGGAVVGNGTTDAGSGGTLLATVEQVDSLYVNFTISAADLITLKQAQSKGDVALAAQNKTTVQVMLPNGTPYDQLGTLDFTDVSVNSTTGAVSLRAQIPNPQHQLLPGMYVSLNVDLGQRNDVYLVPQQAIQRDTVGSYAMVVGADGKVVRKDVDTNDSYRSDWIVTGGLAPGDRVIVAGVQGVREGMLAKTTPWRGTDQNTSLSQSGPASSPSGHRSGSKS